MFRLVETMFISRLRRLTRLPAIAFKAHYRRSSFGGPKCIPRALEARIESRRYLETQNFFIGGENLHGLRQSFFQSVLILP
jgi:hypothetical protein